MLNKPMKKYPDCTKCGRPSLKGTPLCIGCTNLQKHNGIWKKKPRARKLYRNSEDGRFSAKYSGENGHFCIKCGQDSIPVEKMGMLGCCLSCHQKSTPVLIAAYYRFYSTAISEQGARSDDIWLDVRMAKLLELFKRRGYVFEIGQKLRENKTVIRIAKTEPRGDEFVQVPEFNL